MTISSEFNGKKLFFMTAMLIYIGFVYIINQNKVDKVMTNAVIMKF